VALGDTPETTDLEAPQLPMFGLSSRHPLSPQSKRPGLQLPAHYLNDGGLIQPLVGFDGLKGRAILPGHPDDPVDVSACKGSFYGSTLRKDPTVPESSLSKLQARAAKG